MVFGVGDVPQPRMSKQTQMPDTHPPDPRYPNQNQTSRWTGYVLSGLAGLAIGGAIAAFACQSEKESSREQPEAMASTSKTSTTANDSSDPATGEQLTCVICLTEQRGMVLLPCGHVCLCKKCAPRIRDVCPICRKRVTEYKQAFIS